MVASSHHAEIIYSDILHLFTEQDRYTRHLEHPVENPDDPTLVLEGIHDITELP